MTTFFGTSTPATVAEIDQLERYAELTFPEAYRQHLLRYNGGRCEPNVFLFVENGSVTSSMVDRFLPTHKSSWGALQDYIETYKIDEKRIPLGFLPVAHDPGGNLICISCKKGDDGSVYFWDHETEVDYSEEDDSVRTNLHHVADSLPEFLALLTEEPL